MYQIIQKSSSDNYLTQLQSSQLASRHTLQAKQNYPKPVTQLEKDREFEQNRSEASQLQPKKKSGTLTSIEQQSDILQAKMNDAWVQRREKASQLGHNIANIPLNSPHQQDSVLQSKSAIQTKLTIGEPGDKYERDADSVAEKVVKQINSPQFKQQMQTVEHQDEQEDSLQTKPSHDNLQSPSLAEVQPGAMSEPKAEFQAKSIIQRSVAIAGQDASAKEFESDLNSAKRGGKPLDASIRRPMEVTMGANFKQTLIHTDARSNRLNRQLGSRAFATGNHVFFRSGEQNNKKTVAHELRHTMQQGAAPIQRSPLPNQKKSKPNIVEANTKPTSGYELIQRAGEVEAAEHSAKKGIRRGNRRGSVDDTNYDSTVKLFSFLRNEAVREQIVNIMRLGCSVIKNPSTRQKVEDGITKLENDRTYFSAILAELFKTANCGEFAAVTYKYIDENTVDQAVYIVSMPTPPGKKRRDHSLNITAPLPVVKNIGQLDLDNTLVVDSWGNYKVQTLRQFCDGKNPYGDRVDPSELIIRESKETSGLKSLSKTGEYIFKDVAKKVYDLYANSNLYRVSLEDIKKEDAKGELPVFDFKRQNRDVDLTAPEGSGGYGSLVRR